MHIYKVGALRSRNEKCLCGGATHFPGFLNPCAGGLIDDFSLVDATVIREAYLAVAAIMYVFRLYDPFTSSYTMYTHESSAVYPLVGHVYVCLASYAVDGGSRKNPLAQAIIELGQLQIPNISW